jgi:hypothetical protein
MARSSSTSRSSGSRKGRPSAPSRCAARVPAAPSPARAARRGRGPPGLPSGPGPQVGEVGGLLGVARAEHDDVRRRTLAPPAACTQASGPRPKATLIGMSAPSPVGDGRPVVDVDVAVDVGHPEAPDRVAHARQRARHERAAAAEHQRPPPPATTSRTAARTRLRRRQRVSDADHAGGRIALARRGSARRGRRGPRRRGAPAGRRSRTAAAGALGPAGTPDGVDRHADGGPRRGHARRLSASRVAAGRRSAPRRCRRAGASPPAGWSTRSSARGEDRAPGARLLGGGDRLGGAEGRAGRGQRGEDLVASKLPLSHDTRRVPPAPARSTPPVAAGRARRPVARRSARWGRSTRRARAALGPSKPVHATVAVRPSVPARSAPGLGVSSSRSSSWAARKAVVRRADGDLVEDRPARAPSLRYWALQARVAAPRRGRRRRGSGRSRWARTRSSRIGWKPDAVAERLRARMAPRVPGDEHVAARADRDRDRADAPVADLEGRAEAARRRGAR